MITSVFSVKVEPDEWLFGPVVESLGLSQWDAKAGTRWVVTSAVQTVTVKYDGTVQTRTEVRGKPLTKAGDIHGGQGEQPIRCQVRTVDCPAPLADWREAQAAKRQRLAG